MSAQKNRKAKQKLFLVIAGTMGISGLIGAYSVHITKTERQLKPLKAERQQAMPQVAKDKPLADESNLTLAPYSASPVQKAAPLGNATQLPSASELIVSDDACRMLSLLKPNSNSTMKQMVITTYLLSTPFRARFEEYSEILLGYDATRTSFGTFYLGLAHAHWLENEGWTNPYQRSYGRAARLLLQLARTDIGNAAPAAFALIAIEAALIENDASLGISEGEKEEAIELILSATKFDSYTLSYLRELAAFEDPSAVSLLLRLQHLSNLAIPNWNEFRLRWGRSQSLKNEDKLKVVDLIAANALQAKKPSTQLGYSYLEQRFAQSLAGSARAYQTPEQIDSSFPIAHKSNLEKFINETDSQAPSSACQDPRTDPTTAKLRTYVKELRSLDAGLGVSF